MPMFLRFYTLFQNPTDDDLTWIQKSHKVDESKVQIEPFHYSVCIAALA